MSSVCRSVSLIAPLVSGVTGVAGFGRVVQGGQIEHLMSKLRDVTVTLENN